MTDLSVSAKFSTVNFWRYSGVRLILKSSGLPANGGNYSSPSTELLKWEGIMIGTSGDGGGGRSIVVVVRMDSDRDGVFEGYEIKKELMPDSYHGTWHKIEASLTGNRLKVWIDDALWADLTDDKFSILPPGGVALLSYEADTLFDDVVVSVPMAPEKPTSMSISPENFIVSSDGSIVLTATLSSEGSSLPSMKVNWTSTAGTIAAASETTDDSGRVSVTYTAPKVVSATDVTITASFEGDGEYLASTGSSSGKIGIIKLDLDPNTLNLKSNGKWITGYIELSSGLKVKDIDIGTVKLEYKEHKIKAARGSIDDGVLMTKFDRRELVDLLKSETRPAEVKLLVTGNIMLEGTAIPFAASDTIRVIMPGRTSSRVNVGFSVKS
ncbi:MAG: hypothetical protein AB1305_00890 [Candidatus Hadarchaeota archaeon]